VIVWVWDARGPDRSSAGVTGGDEKRARRLARESLIRTGASEVLVEQALTALDAATLIYGYQRTGYGWRGHRTPAGHVSWRRFTTAGDTVRERTAAGAWR
jgi:hypothetical protein